MGPGNEEREGTNTISAETFDVNKPIINFILSIAFILKNVRAYWCSINPDELR